MEREELKPCPFCGNDPWEYVKDNGLVVECTKCKAKIYRAFVPPAEWEKMAIKCRKDWNKRVNETRRTSE